MQAGLLGFLIISQNGLEIAIPSIPSFSAPVVPISADSIFSTMTLATGQMDISFTNGLPIDITNVVFELRNRSTNELIVQGNFPLIASILQKLNRTIWMEKHWRESLMHN